MESNIERMQVEEALRRSENQFRTLVSLLPVGIYLTDPEGRCQFANARWCEMAGMSVEEALGEGWIKGLHPEDRSSVLAAWQKMVASEGHWGLDYRFQTPAGKVTWVYGLAAPQRNELGEIVGYVGVNTDNTERRKTELKLLESDDRYRRITATITDYIYTVRVTDGRVVETEHGPGCLTVTGYQEHEFAKDPFLWFRMVVAEDRPKVEAQARMVLDGEMPPPLEHRIVRKNGTERWVRNTFVLHRDEHGNLRSYDGLIQDITDRKLAEAEKDRLEALDRRIQKSESLGRMAGAIAHHFNNKLHGVMVSLELAMDDLPRDCVAVRDVKEAMNMAHEAAEMSQLMLTCLGKTFDKLYPLDLSGVCRQHLTVLQTTLPEDGVLETDLPCSGPIIQANDLQIQKILSSLITNAWEALGGGRVTIRLSVKTVSPADIPGSNRWPIAWQPQDHDYACLAVADSGCGIANEDYEFLFDPFFTKKFIGRGLGLPVVLGIAEVLGGAVTVESVLGKGSTFRIYFPMASSTRLPGSVL